MCNRPASVAQNSLEAAICRPGEIDWLESCRCPPIPCERSGWEEPRLTIVAADQSASCVVFAVDRDVLQRLARFTRGDVLRLADGVGWRW